LATAAWRFLGMCSAASIIETLEDNINEIVTP